VVRRTVRLWFELLRLSWRRFPLQTAGMILIKVCSVAVVAGSALALRAAVNAIVDGDADAAVVASCVAALSYGLMAYLDGVDNILHFLLVEKIGLVDLQVEIDSGIAGLDGLEHLEHADFLDRVSVVRGSAWGLVFGMWVAVDAVFNMLRLVVLLTLLGIVSPWLLLLLAFAAAPLWFERRGMRAVIAAEIDSAESFRLQRHLFNLSTDAATSKELRTAGAGQAAAAMQADAWKDVTHLRVRARVIAAFWQFGGWLVFTAGFLAALILVADRALRGPGTIGDIVLAITVAVSLRQAVQTAVSRTSATADAGRQIEPFLWLREYTAAHRKRAETAVPPPETLTEGIVLDHVSLTYPGTERPALDDVSLRLASGSVVALVGEYGSGKTTLVKLLAKLYAPDDGAILVDGVDLADIDTAAWRERMSAAFQDFGRFQTVFAETIGLGDLPHLTDRERILAAVRDADATGLVERLPDGLDTQLGRALGGVDLSEGQWQKTALARASMRRRPLLLVLDEPTASLDAPSENEVFERYMTRARETAREVGAIVVIISHRFSTVTGADRILVMERGRLIESGTHAELLQAGGRYADLYGIQATAYARG
jgi:ABC-type multidrug transport system fused ATPase/permease subunit